MRIVASDPRWKTSGEEMQSAEVFEVNYPSLKGGA